MAKALDATESLPIALCGGLAEPMLKYLPQNLKKRVTQPEGDSASGALIMIKNHFFNTFSEG
jgi:glucosamine kinase